MQQTMRYLIVIASLAFAAVALAHEGHDHGADKDHHIKGKVSIVTGEKIVVDGTDGKTVEVHVDGETKYESGDQPGRVSDLKTGTKVVVHGRPMKDGTLHATKVRYPRAVPKSSGRDRKR